VQSYVNYTAQNTLLNFCCYFSTGTWLLSATSNIHTIKSNWGDDGLQFKPERFLPNGHYLGGTTVDNEAQVCLFYVCLSVLCGVACMIVNSVYYFVFVYSYVYNCIIVLFYSKIQHILFVFVLKSNKTIYLIIVLFVFANQKLTEMKLYFNTSCY
jgi:hypothetical protein